MSGTETLPLKNAGDPADRPMDLGKGMIDEGRGMLPGEAAEAQPLRPLADRMRPASLNEVLGQRHLLGPDGPLGTELDAGPLPSTILWGPPGVGKTTIARLIAQKTGHEFVQVSAVYSNTAEIRRIVAAARDRRLNGRGTVLFVDEIHRFNKAQQDGFLPYIEDGTIVLVGATTENPSFELNAALMSRTRVLVLERLDREALGQLLSRAETHLGATLPLTPEARHTLLDLADGDARALLNLVEQLAAVDAGEQMDSSSLLRRVSQRAAIHDKSGDWHYNLISALHKSVRGSDPDASLYWLARMLNAGEDARFVARRLTRMASEDVGLADPDALQVCLAAWEAYERLGSPEGELALAQATIYLSLAPKSNAAYLAYKEATSSARRSGSEPPPKHILNSPTGLMKDIGYSAGYKYDHDERNAFSGQNYFPDGMERSSFYSPVERGFEREMKKRMEYFAKLRHRAGTGGSG